MRPINYQLTNIIVNNLIKLEKTKARLEILELNEEITEKYINKKFIYNIFYTANQLGINMTFNDTQRFIEGKMPIQGDLKLTLLNNYRNTLEFLRANKKNVLMNIDTNVLLHINKLLIINWKDSWEAKIRTDISIDNTVDSWIALQDDTIQTHEIETEVMNTLDWDRTNKERINPVIRAGVVLYRSMRIMPFPSMNKFTILCLVDLMLQQNGYQDKTFLSIMKLYGQREEEYLNIWTQTIQSPTGNITPWIEKFITDITFEYQEIENELKQEIEKEKSKSYQPFLNLNRRQLKVLKYLQTIHSIKREDYVQMFDVSTMTAYRDLNDLVDRKLLKIEGQGRGTKYQLANR